MFLWKYTLFAYYVRYINTLLCYQDLIFKFTETLHRSYPPPPPQRVFLFARHYSVEISTALSWVTN